MPIFFLGALLFSSPLICEQIASPPSTTEAPSVKIDQPVMSSVKEEQPVSPSLPVKAEQPIKRIERVQAIPKVQTLDLRKVFMSSPVIYSILLLMSIFSVSIWLHTLAIFRTKEIMPGGFVDQIYFHLTDAKYEAAATLCRSSPNLFSTIILAGLSTRKHGMLVMNESMKTEGKRLTAYLWQRLALLNDIAIVAPMLGLLGTVIGMFYAFYDVNRSIESINALFDGLGIAVGTTVAGLIIAILSMLLSTTLKFRLVKNLSTVEHTALSMATKLEVE